MSRSEYQTHPARTADFSSQSRLSSTQSFELTSSLFPLFHPPSRSKLTQPIPTITLPQPRTRSVRRSSPPNRVLLARTEKSVPSFPPPPSLPVNFLSTPSRSSSENEATSPFPSLLLTSSSSRSLRFDRQTTASSGRRRTVWEESPSPSRGRLGSSSIVPRGPSAYSRGVDLSAGS